MAYSVVVDPVPDEHNQGGTFSASVNDQHPFIVGKGVGYRQRRGLMSVQGGPSFDPDDYPELGQWAQLMDCTSFCESNRILTCLNTYDRAAFTFGCLQFAAHVANGDFVTWFRELLQRDDAANFFPDLRVVDGRICRVRDTATEALESDASTSGLMSYLNPDGQKVDVEEITAAARFIYWTTSEPTVRDSQIEHGASLFRSLVSSHARALSLNGKPDFVISAVVDILHQGRGTLQQIRRALEPTSSETQLDRLLEIGAADYGSRCSDLRSIIGQKQRQGLLGMHAYDATKADFVASGTPFARLTRKAVAPLARELTLSLDELSLRTAPVGPATSPLSNALATFERRKDCVQFVGITAPDANIPGNLLVVTNGAEFHSFRAEDIVDTESVDERRSCVWVRMGARAWRSCALQVAETPMMRETMVGMEDLPAPSMPVVPGMPEEASASHRAHILSLSLAQKTITAAAAAYRGTCAGGDHYANNCAHFLSDAFIRSGFDELAPGGSASGFVTARCGTPAKRVIRARDMWHWFQSKGTDTSTSLERNTGFWAVFQLDEQVYWGGHVVIVDTDSWTYHGTACYFGWKQYAYKW